MLKQLTEPKRESEHRFVETKDEPEAQQPQKRFGENAPAKASIQEPKSGGMPISEGVQRVKSDGENLNWVLYRFDPQKKDVVFHESGTKGYGEFVQAVDDEMVEFGFVRYDLEEGDSRGGFRPTKFVFITWIGPDVTAITRAKANAHAKKVAKEMSPHHISVTAESFEDLDPDEIVRKLKSVGFHL